MNDIIDDMPNWSAEIGALAAAKARAQTKFRAIDRDKSVNAGRYSYTYADLASCLDAVIPALSEEGIALFQPVRVEIRGDEARAVATTMLVHGESGQWLASEYAALALDARDARSVGSAATYARRYGLLGMLGIASADEDDDGASARGGNHEMAEATQKKPAPAKAETENVGSSAQVPTPAAAETTTALLRKECLALAKEMNLDAAQRAALLKELKIEDMSKASTEQIVRLRGELEARKAKL